MNPPADSPNCIAIIMDGNRRWAKERGKESWEGHVAGQKTFKDVVRWVRAHKIPHLIVYAFSTENWNRTEEEVGHILDLARSFFQTEIKDLVDERIRLRFAGDRARFPADIQTMMQEAEEKTKDFAAPTVMITASYGGRAEILAATRSLIERGVADVDEKTFANAMWTSGFPDPDLLIRTGGEKRLSNFLPWQSTYSELFFTDTLWPDFSEAEFVNILQEYSVRTRKFGT